MIATYFVQNDGSLAIKPIGSESATVFIKQGANGFYEFGEGTNTSTLYIKNTFTGEYAVAGGGNLVIGNFGYNRTANGTLTFFGEEEIEIVATLSNARRKTRA